jgi:hypothetical protein
MLSQGSILKLNEKKLIRKIFPQTPLTRIRNPYTLSPTQAESSEADDLVVKHFLQTLAEIALAVASRKGKGVK